MMLYQLVYEDLNTFRGVGDDARTLRDSLDSLFRDLCRSESIGSARRQTLKAIDEVSGACEREDWDGYGAEAVRVDTLREARRFAKALSSEFPAPEVGADPDGEISFDWDLGPRRVFSVSVSQAGRLSYAGLFGTSTVHGSEDFRGQVPRAIVYNLARLLETVH
jgi:hypothetical protein